MSEDDISESQVRAGEEGAGGEKSEDAENQEQKEGSDPSGLPVDDDDNAASKAGAGIDFNEDIHASAEYRVHLTTVLAERAIRAAASRAY